MTDLLRAAYESGAFSWTLGFAAVLAAGTIIKVGVTAWPALIREWTRKAVVRQALHGHTKAERDRAMAVLKLLEGARPNEHELIDKPDDPGG